MPFLNSAQLFFCPSKKTCDSMLSTYFVKTTSPCFAIVQTLFFHISNSSIICDVGSVQLGGKMQIWLRLESLCFQGSSKIICRCIVRSLSVMIMYIQYIYISMQQMVKGLTPKCSLSLCRVARGSKHMFLELIHGLFIT